MRIARIEAFQVHWRPEDAPSARSGFLRVWSDDGRCGLGEVSPMQGGLVSLTILKHHIAPAIGLPIRRPGRSGVCQVGDGDFDAGTLRIQRDATGLDRGA